MVQSTGDSPWSKDLLDRRRYVVRRVHIRRAPAFRTSVPSERRNRDDFNDLQASGTTDADLLAGLRRPSLDENPFPSFPTTSPVSPEVPTFDGIGVGLADVAA